MRPILFYIKEGNQIAEIAQAIREANVANCDGTVSAMFAASATPVFAQVNFFKGRSISVDIGADVGAALTLMVAIYPQANFDPLLVRNITTAIV